MYVAEPGFPSSRGTRPGIDTWHLWPTTTQRGAHSCEAHRHTPRPRPLPRQVPAPDARGARDARGGDKEFLDAVLGRRQGRRLGGGGQRPGVRLSGEKAFGRSKVFLKAFLGFIVRSFCFRFIFGSGSSFFVSGWLQMCLQLAEMKTLHFCPCWFERDVYTIENMLFSRRLRQMEVTSFWRAKALEKQVHGCSAKSVCG